MWHQYQSFKRLDDYQRIFLFVLSVILIILYNIQLKPSVLEEQSSSVTSKPSQQHTIELNNTIQLWQTILGDKEDREGLSWEFYPPYPFQKYTQVIPHILTVRGGDYFSFTIIGYDILKHRVTRGNDMFLMWMIGTPNTSSAGIRMSIQVIDLFDGRYLGRGRAPLVSGQYVIRTWLSHINMTIEACNHNFFPEIGRAHV